MPPGIGYGTSTQALIAAARGNGGDPAPPDLGGGEVNPLPRAEVDTPQGTEPSLKEAGFVQPAGDPFHYKVLNDGETVMAYSPEEGFVETDVQTVKANLSDKAISEMGLTPPDGDGTTQQADRQTQQGPSGQDLANDLQGALNRQRSPQGPSSQGQSQADTGGQGVLDLIQQVAPTRPDSAAQSPPSARTQDTGQAAQGQQQGDVNAEAAFGNVMDLIGMVRKMRQGQPQDVTIRLPDVLSAPSTSPDSTRPQRTRPAAGRDRNDGVRPTRAFRAEQDVFEAIQAARGTPSAQVSFGQPQPSGSVEAAQQRSVQFPSGPAPPDTIRAEMPELAQMRPAEPSTFQQLLQLIGMGR
jgi:hypothetical protein